MSGSSEVQSVAAEPQIQLLDGKTLKLEGPNLVIQDSNATKLKANRNKSSINGNIQLIPLYNILWAEISEGTLTIEFALQASKSLFKNEKLQLSAGSDESQELKTFVDSLLSKAYGPALQKKRAYVLINPNSGPGNGTKKWETIVKPLFEAARMKLDVVILSRGGEATELAQRIDIDNYDTIVACSGDGTPHEIFNGLAKRPDATAALAKLAISHIPCGSGNAMACNLYGSHKPSFAALSIVKGVVTPLDLVSITQGGRRIISFLSQALGIIAESDLGTEHLRWMGSSRFDVGVVSRLFRRRCYPCDLALKVEAEEKPSVKEHYKRHASVASQDMKTTSGGQKTQGQGLPALKYGTVHDELPDGWELVSYDKIGNFYCGNMAYMAPDVLFFSAALTSDGCMDLVTINGDLHPLAALKTFMSVESNKFFDDPNVTYKKISAYRIIPRNQKDGYISIDGEKVPFEPFQAEIHQGLGRVISKRGTFEAEGPENWDNVTMKERLRA